MNKVFSLVLISLFCAGMAEARLGETHKQCDERYGEPISFTKSKKTMSCVYRKAEFVVEIEFEKRRAIIFRPFVAIKVTYSKPEKKGEEKKPLTETEIKVLLNSNTGTHRWQEVDMFIEAAKTTSLDERIRVLRDAENFTVWTRHDDAQVVHDIEKCTLTFSDGSIAGPKAPGESSDMSGF